MTKVYSVANSDVDAILSEFAITRESLPELIISAMFNESPSVHSAAFDAIITSDLGIVLGHTRRFRRLELAINIVMKQWLDNK